jgi:hypothetical protein
MGEACSTHGKKMENAFYDLVGKSEGIPTRKWEDNIKTDLKERVCEDMDWV